MLQMVSFRGGKFIDRNFSDEKFKFFFLVFLVRLVGKNIVLVDYEVSAKFIFSTFSSFFEKKVFFSVSPRKNILCINGTVLAEKKFWVKKNRATPKSKSVFYRFLQRLTGWKHEFQ